MSGGLLWTLYASDIRNTQFVQDDCQFQIICVAICLMIFGAHMHILFNIKVKILKLIKWSYRSPHTKK
jgi:cytochrome b subunit of formate dehydrogenase